MSEQQQNIDRLRSAIEAFNRTGELDAANIAPDFEVHQASSIIDTAGVFHGVEGMRQSLAEIEGAFEDVSYEPEQILEAPGGEFVVLIRARGRGKGSGIELDNEIAWVWTYRAGKAIRLEVYEDRAEALAAVDIRH